MTEEEGSSGEPQRPTPTLLRRRPLTRRATGHTKHNTRTHSRTHNTHTHNLAEKTLAYMPCDNHLYSMQDPKPLTINPKP